VIAIGTTVVRALEHAARLDGTIRSGNGIATERVGPFTQLRVVDAIVSGVHERGTSHYELLRAFQDGESLERMESEAEARGYRRHEFGDSVFLERSSSKFLEAQGAPTTCAHHGPDSDRPAINPASRTAVRAQRSPTTCATPR
jgi:S-adenosylmethionine:tRNA ribosyltransferase-isomerase